MAFPLPNYTGDFMFLTRGHFLSNYSLGRKKKKILKQNARDGVQAKHKVEQEERRRKTLYIAQRASDTSLKCRMRTLQK